MIITAAEIKELAKACGFQLAGITSALPSGDFERFDRWRATGMAGEMSYLTDQRGDLREDPRNLLPEARSILCVGKLYNSDYPYSTECGDSSTGWISRYAWGTDYHVSMRNQLEELVQRVREYHPEPFHYRICVDTAPLLERSYARAAGLGWIGRNTCLINQQQGSWFFLAELLLSIPLVVDQPAPFRCGSCTRCIEACPTQAIVPDDSDGWTLDARMCISYLTIEKRGEIPADLAVQIENHLFGCDICQDVCPWNRRAPIADDLISGPFDFTPDLKNLAELDEETFRTLFRRSPVWRAKYQGFLRNVAIAMGNSRNQKMLRPLEKLSVHPDPVVARAASNALLHLVTVVGLQASH